MPNTGIGTGSATIVSDLIAIYAIALLCCDLNPSACTLHASDSLTNHAAILH